MDLDILEVIGACLLFCLVFCMSATVDIGCLMAQIKNRRAIATGLFLQFVILPFLGFLVVRTLGMSNPMGITLLVVTSSPGGSYSNWWCSMFNADLALSVTMTAMSTVLSVVALPVNLMIYTRLSYDDDVVSSLDWTALFTSLAIVLFAIGLGLYTSERLNSHNFNLHANRVRFDKMIDRRKKERENESNGGTNRWVSNALLIQVLLFQNDSHSYPPVILSLPVYAFPAALFVRATNHQHHRSAFSYSSVTLLESFWYSSLASFPTRIPTRNYGNAPGDSTLVLPPPVCLVSLLRTSSPPEWTFSVPRECKYDACIHACVGE